jgi:Fe-Mn family superoxide dismutase
MYKLPKLNYEYKDLSPQIDAKTMKIHHTKHHQGYVDKLNQALRHHPELQKKDINQLLSEIRQVPAQIRQQVINFGGGHANHSLYWQIMKPGGSELEEGKLQDAINERWDQNNFKQKFIDNALSRFGSGWGWLVVNKDRQLELISTANQNSPLMDGYQPILGVDVWEHAYYLNYQNKRADYLAAFWEVIDWKQVGQLFQKAMN